MARAVGERTVHYAHRQPARLRGDERERFAGQRESAEISGAARNVQRPRAAPLPHQSIRVAPSPCAECCVGAGRAKAARPSAVIARSARRREDRTICLEARTVQRITTPQGSSPTGMSAILRFVRRVDHRDRVGAAAGDVELLAVGRERHVPRAPADRDRGDDRVGRRVDHLHGAVAARGDVDALAVGMHGDAVAALAGLDARDDVVRLRVEHVHRVRVLRGDVGAAAVGQEADAARPVADLDRFHHFAARDVDDVDHVGLLGADVEPLAVGAEHRVLGILALHLDALRDRRAWRYRPAAPGRSPRSPPRATCRRATGRSPRASRRGRTCATSALLLEIHDEQRVGRLVAHEQPLAVGRKRDAARLLADLAASRRPYRWRCRSPRSRRSLVGHIGERRGAPYGESASENASEAPARARRRSPRFLRIDKSWSVLRGIEPPRRQCVHCPRDAGRFLRVPLTAATCARLNRSRRSWLPRCSRRCSRCPARRWHRRPAAVRALDPVVVTATRQRSASFDLPVVDRHRSTAARSATASR